jgi:hypothetical protein
MYQVDYISSWLCIKLIMYQFMCQVDYVKLIMYQADCVSSWLCIKLTVYQVDYILSWLRINLCVKLIVYQVDGV